jgi:translocation and assembly module TamB
VARAAAWLGWAVLGTVALVGLAVSAAALLAALPFARGFVASQVVRVLDDAIAGTVDLDGIEVLPQGGIELRGLEVFDPDGHLVLAVGRARVSADVTALRARILGLEVELEAPSVLLEEEPGGGVSLARAFGPARPAPPGERAVPAERGDEGVEGGGWTVHLSRVVIRRGEVWWVDAAGATRLEGALDVEARGTIGARRTRAELRLDGELREPIASPLALEIVASRRGGAVRVPVLRIEAGGTVVEAIAEGDVARRRGRVALTRLAVSRAQARALLERAPEGADLRAVGYAEADGETLTAAVAVEPAAPGDGGGRGDVAVAARVGALGRAAGFDVALDRLDPSRLSADAPAGELTLSARGAAAGSSREDARARLSLSASRSRLRGGEIARVEAQLRAERGDLRVDRLDASAPGVSISGAGRWRREGPVAGSADVDARDLAAATRNLERLLGTSLPDLAGRARIRAELSGTSGAPAVTGTVDAPALRGGGIVTEGLRLAFEGRGPVGRLDGRAEGRIVRLARATGADLARQISLRAALQGEDGTVSLTGAVPGAGTEPLTATARGRLGPGRRSLLLSELAVSWPGARWTLAGPATVELEGPSVDRLELVAEDQRVALAGGLRGRALEARAELSRVDLARLPPGVLPEADGIRGVVSASLEARGAPARPLVRGTLALEGGAFREIAGVAASGQGTYDGERRRATLALSAARGAGGSADVALDVPLPLAGRPGEPLSARVRAEGIPLEEALRIAKREDPAKGALALDVRVEGTVGGPALHGEISLASGAWRDLEDLAFEATIEDPGDALRVVASGSIAGRRVLGVTAEAPLDLGHLVGRPGETLRALARAPFEATADVAALDLAAVEGRAGVPEGLAGVVKAQAAISGRASAPRVRATVELAGGAWKGWRRLGAQIDLAATDAGLSASGRVSAAGQDAVRFEASLAAAPERLGRRAALLAAPIRLEAVVPRVSIAPVAADAAPLAGTLEGRVVLSGTLAAPEARAELRGADVSIEARPLGAFHATASYAGGQGAAEVLLRPASGGTLRTTATLAADLGLGARARPLRDAPAEVTAKTDGVDLAFLAALWPSRIRSAAGRLVVDVAAKGPLGRLSPRGTLRVSGGRIAVTELGEWTDVAVDARVTDDLFEVSRLEVRRGKGSLSATASATGLGSQAARVSAKLEAKAFTVARAGMDLATIDLDADASGTWRSGELALEVKVPEGVVRLPRRAPRSLQSLEPRKDIVVGRPPEPKKAAPGDAAAAAAGAAATDPFTLRAHVVVPRNFFVKSENPKGDVELKADVRYELTGGQDFAEGSVEVVRGAVEPIAGRNFVIERGKVQFTGGPPRAALLDVEAKYTNPAAVVTVTAAGAVTAPEIRLTSQPPMDEAQIAMLIATGRTELKAGSGAVGTLTGEEAGKAALGAVATQAFRNLVADKLPLDTVALDAGTLRAGKYVTDRIYVGYVRRFDADPTKNENEDEVRVEYQITPNWMFESRYGNAQSGGASLIWSRDY